MKNKAVTIVMYHYIRDLKHSRYPSIRGLDISLFKEQIDYLQKHYTIITMELLINAIDNHYKLPEKPILLTFDDAYADHYLSVFPILNEKGIQGSFFPPVKAITEHTVLDVNKIHFILASVDNIDFLVSEVLLLLKKYQDEYKLNSPDYYFEKLAKTDRYDNRETIFVKRLLQVELKEEIRNKLTDELFLKFVGVDENSFSRELYMNIDQIKCMRRNGMHIGNHGYDHYWLNSLSKEKQTEEINKSLEFIKLIGGDINNWTMCYPYGAYNDDTIDIIKKRGCKLAVTTKVDIADLSKYDKLELPRLDTNDFPKDNNAEKNDWFYLG